MRDLSQWAALLLAALITATTAPAAAGSEMPEWSHQASIHLEGPTGNGVVELELTPEVHDMARRDLGDLRVAAETGDEAPYVLRLAEARATKVTLKTRLYNRTYIEGTQSCVTVDFGSKALKNRVQVRTPGTDFRREVLVEGSDDGRSWQTLRGRALLFRVSRGPTGPGYEKSEVALPDNDQRYLRVTVYNGADDPARIRIRSVAAWHLVQQPADVAAVPVLDMAVFENEKERRTEITLDLGYRNLPLHELQVRLTDANFFRRARVLGRNCKERVIRTPVEDGSLREETVPEPWAHVTGGVLYRFSGGGSTDESVGLRISGARYRYLQLWIDNRDDPPLHCEGAGVNRLRRYLAFQPKWDGVYTLYFGNTSAGRPRYDIVHYVDRLRSEGVARATLGAAMPNPAYRPDERPVPWSERYSGIIWLALLAALGVLGLLVYRQVKAAPAGP